MLIAEFTGTLTRKRRGQEALVTPLLRTNLFWHDYY